MTATDLPDWPGADICYQRASRIATHIARTAYEAQRSAYKGRPTAFRFAPPVELTDLIEAMNRGDEEAIKAAIASNLTVALSS